MPSVADNANVANRPTDNQEEGERWPPHGKVAELAYQLWCERGREDGHAEADWVRAEKQLAAQRPPAAGQ